MVKPSAPNALKDPHTISYHCTNYELSSAEAAPPPNFRCAARSSMVAERGSSLPAQPLTRLMHAADALHTRDHMKLRHGQVTCR
jgi:hypothetical protein